MNEVVKTEEINKWLDKIEAIVGKIHVEDPRAQSWLTNMEAYIADSKHFRDTGDLVRGFEAVVWSWAIFEILLDLKMIKIEE